jgi:heme exporter protein B
LTGAFAPSLARGLRLASGRRLDSLVAPGFFMLLAAVFPIALAGLAPLPAVAPALLWISAFLAVVLSSHRLFADDAAGGVIEQLLTLPSPVGAVGGILAAHWAATTAPLLVVLPLVGLTYGLDAARIVPLALSLLAGTPALCMLCALGAALSTGARGGALLYAIVVIPLAFPVMLFGVGATQGDPTGGWHAGAFALLGAFAIATAALGPFAVHAALRIASE